MTKLPPQRRIASVRRLLLALVRGPAPAPGQAPSFCEVCVTVTRIPKHPQVATRAEWSARAAGGERASDALARREPRSTPMAAFAAIASGALLAIAFPRPGAFPCAWISLVPWLVVLPRLTARQAAAGSLLLGVVFFAALCSWLSIFGAAPWLLTALFQGAFAAVALFGAWWCRQTPPAWRVLGTAGLWTTAEWLRGIGPFGFTWGWLGYSQSPWLDIIQIVSTTGVPGLSFLIVAHNAALAEALRTADRSAFGRLRLAVPVWGVIVVVALLGRQAVARSPHLPRTLDVAVLQMTVREPSPADVTRVWTEEITEVDRAVLLDLSRRAAAKYPDLIIAPESALPGALTSSPSLYSGAQHAAVVSGGWLLIGAHAADAGQRYYNSAYLFSPAGSLADRYDKVHLVPFGEYVPGRAWLPGIKHYPVSVGDLTPGRSVRPLTAGAARVGVSICFESAFPWVSRRLVREGANLLAVITNDGWFYRTAAAAQHRQIAVFRAVETRRWLARSALTGISCIISPQGSIVQELGLYRRGVLAETVGLGEGRTLSVKYGDWFVLLAGMLAAGALADGFLRRGRQRVSTRKVVQPNVT